jgi:Chalcone isomerase-like
MVLAIALMIAPRAAPAVTLAGIDIPETYQIDGKTLVLNGYALRTLTLLRVKIYVAALYMPQKTYDAQGVMASPGPKVVVVHYLHSGTKDQVESRYREGEAENCGNGGCDASLEADFERLVKTAPAIEAGDTATFVVTDKTLRIAFNNRPLEQFGRAALGNLVLASFIGPHPPSTEFRASLLGLMKP